MLKKLNKNGVNFDSKKKKFFTSSKRKPISEMDCYNCGELGHLALQCPKPKKDKYKKNKEQDDSSDDDKNEKKPYKKKGGKKEYHKKKNGKAYIVGDCTSRNVFINYDSLVTFIFSSQEESIP